MLAGTCSDIILIGYLCIGQLRVIKGNKKINIYVISFDQRKKITDNKITTSLTSSLSLKRLEPLLKIVNYPCV